MRTALEFCVAACIPYFATGCSLLLGSELPSLNSVSAKLDAFDLPG